MQTPFQPSPNPLQSVRVGLAFLLTGSAVVFTATLALRLHSVHKAYDQDRLDRMHEAVLVRADYLKSTQSYDGCIVEAAQIPAGSLFYSPAKTLQDQCQNALHATILSRAQTLAETGQFKEAIAELQTFPDGNSDAQVQQLIWEWSNRILQVAEGYYLSSDASLPNAIQAASTITSDNPLYTEAQLKIRRWQLEWSANQQNLQAARAALSTHQPEVALLQVQQLTHPYWSQQSEPITNAAYAEIAFRNQAASELAEPDQSNPDQAAQIDQPGQKDDAIAAIQVQIGTVALSGKLLLPLGIIALLLLSCRSSS